MLDRAQIVTVDNRFRFKVRHASNSRRHNTTGFLILQDGAGHCGYGEFLTREYVTGESVEQAQGTLSQLLREFPLELIDEPFRQLSEISSRLTGLPGVQAALCALDLAILDLSSKRQGRSIAALFGNEAVSDQLFPQYTAVYPLTSSWKLQGLALVYHRVLGLSEVKLKGSGDLETDCRVLRALRKFLPSTCSVRIDFNEQLSQLGAAEYLARQMVK